MIAKPLPIVTGETYPTDVVRPLTRGDCVGGARPCPWVSCRQHMLIDSISTAGEPRSHFDDVEEMAETCALDVADRGGIPLEDVGDLMRLTRERIRQIEQRSFVKAEKLVERSWLDGFTSPEVVAHGEDYAFIGPSFKAAVQKAFERIVPEHERGSQMLRGKPPAPEGES